jgi:hypothetical protein
MLCASSTTLQVRGSGACETYLLAVAVHHAHILEGCLAGKMCWCQGINNGGVVHCVAGSLSQCSRSVFQSSAVEGLCYVSSTTLLHSCSGT